MENATKALLIAAAVLVAILIISLGLVVYDMAASTMDSVNFTGQEVTAHNEKFTRYNGQHKRGTEVNAMLKTVMTSNLDAKTAAEPSRLVTVVQTSNNATTTLLTTGATSIGTAIEPAKLYTITVQYDGLGGLVNTIVVTEETKTTT